MNKKVCCIIFMFCCIASYDASSRSACSTASGVYQLPDNMPVVKGDPCRINNEIGITLYELTPYEVSPRSRGIGDKQLGYRGRIAGALGANREMQLAAECSQASDPQAIAACIAQRLTAEELEKCRQGIGTEGGCFGPSNTLRWHVENAIKDLTKGPGDHNDLVGREGFTCKRLGVCF